MPERIGDIDFEALRQAKDFHPSPHAWEDQVLYFLLLDRFSDGRESGYRGNDGKPVLGGQTPRFDAARDAEAAVRDPASAAAWRAAGEGWCGGNLRGLRHPGLPLRRGLVEDPRYPGAPPRRQHRSGRGARRLGCHGLIAARARVVDRLYIISKGTLYRTDVK